jgi:hypothetical protein
MPGYGSPGGVVPPTFPKKRIWPKVLLGVGLALILLIGGCTVLVVRSARNIVGVGNKFLSALQTSADSGAKAACSNAPREELGILRSKLTEAGWTGEKYLTSFATSSATGVEPSGSVSGVVKVRAGYHPVVLTLGKDSDWCVKSASVDFTQIVSKTGGSQ